MGATLGLLMYCAGMFASSFATEIWQLYLTFGVVVGFGENLHELSRYTLLGLWFPDKYYCRSTSVVLTAPPLGEYKNKKKQKNKNEMAW